ncbi:MAG: FHA domain-containing protein, partial [Myxococcales bacterium]|nr:FHA domain-containing protein [Myxococcales bacterium]
MSDYRNPFDDATAVADPSQLQKPKRNFANVVKRAKLPSKAPPTAMAPAPAKRQPTPVSRPHVIGRDSAGLPEDSSEVLLTPPNISLPHGKGQATTFFPPEGMAAEEYTVEEGQPQPPPPFVEMAEQASIAIAPPDDLDRGFLIITGGNDRGRKVGLPEGRTTIGRGIDCDIVLTDIAVSRRHMYVERRDNVYFLCDLSSGNGTFVNNEDRRGEVVVVNGDTFQIGNSVFSFEGPRAQDSASATTNRQPETVASGKKAPLSLDNDATNLNLLRAADAEEESTVAGKGLAGSSHQAQRDPPSEQLPTSIVASVEVSTQILERPHRGPTKPPPPPHDRREFENAALAAVSSIVQTPPLEDLSIIPHGTGDLPELNAPVTQSPSAPYPVPNQQPRPQNPGPAAPSARLPAPIRPYTAPPILRL